jgi:hypothetical protein
MIRPIFLIALAGGCVGIRHVARPPSPDGYMSVALRDIPAIGMKDVNVEVVGMLGPMVPQEVCGGLITFPLFEITANAVGGLHFSTSGVTLSLPRSRYNEIRDLHANDQVRARGYASKYFAQGCDWFMMDANRYVWVDTIEKVSLP